MKKKNKIKIQKYIKIYDHLQQEDQRTETQILNIRTHVQIFLHFLVNQTQTLINLQQEHKHKPNNRSSQIFSNHKTQIYKIITQTQIFSSFNQP